MKVVWFIEPPQAGVIAAILKHCGLWQSQAPRAPPEVHDLVLELDAAYSGSSIDSPDQADQSQAERFNQLVDQYWKGRVGIDLQALEFTGGIKQVESGHAGGDGEKGNQQLEESRRDPRALNVLSLLTVYGDRE